MPWWGFALCGFGLYLIGLISGRGLGRAEILQQLFAHQTMSTHMNPLMGLQRPRGENAGERQA